MRIHANDSMRTGFLTRRAIAAVALAAGLGACTGDLLKVENPDIIPPENLESATAIPALQAGAIGDFSLAINGDNGGTEGLLLVSGSMSDELGNSETFPTRKEFDQRVIDIRNTTLTAVFRRVHRARFSAEQAAEKIKKLATNPATEPRIAEMYGLAGLVYTHMAEDYCSGVPVSNGNIATGEIEYGEPLTTTQLFELAIQRFDSALAYPANATVQNLARVGKGRALLNLGKVAEAATAVTAVPTTFAYNTTHTLTAGVQNNGPYVFINLNERFTVIDKDGGNGLDFRSANDPRVTWDRSPSNDVGFDAATPQFDQGKFASEIASIGQATGLEARLIEAEAKLKAGDVAGWLAGLNTLRATAALYPTAVPSYFTRVQGSIPLPALTDPGTEAGRVDLMFRERAFWLYLSGHRLGDLRRLVRQYGRTADAVFPGGGAQPYIINGNNKGGNFGNDYNLPVPFDEQNNPLFTQCIDRNP
jgi:hypothetical protein